MRAADPTEATDSPLDVGIEKLQHADLQGELFLPMQ